MYKLKQKPSTYIPLFSWLGSLLLLGAFALVILPKIYAQAPPCVEDPNLANVSEGIISSPIYSSTGPKFTSSIGCVNQNPAYIDLNQADVRISSFEDLWSRYYNRSFQPKATFTTTLPPIVDKTLYYSTQDFSVTSDITSTNNAPAVGVIFVRGDLNILTDIKYGEDETGQDIPNSGLIFIVSGQVKIDPAVKQINGIIISQDTICSNYNFPSGPCTSNKNTLLGPDNQLLVKGNLVALDASNPPKLVRDLTGTTLSNSISAELIQVQPKYFVLLREILSQKLSYTTENTNYAIQISPCTTTFSGCTSRCRDEAGLETRICPDDTTGDRAQVCIRDISCLACSISPAATNACTAEGQDSGSKTFTINYYDVLSRPEVNSQLSIDGVLTPDIRYSTTQEFHPTPPTRSAEVTASNYHSGTDLHAIFDMNDAGQFNNRENEHTSCTSSAFSVDIFASCPTICTETASSVGTDTACGTVNCPANVSVQHPDNFNLQCLQCNASGLRNQYYDGLHCAAQTCPFPYAPAPGQESLICGTRTGSSPNLYDSTGCSLAVPDPSSNLKSYYPGNSCSESSCYPNPQLDCSAEDAEGCHEAISGFNGLGCTNIKVCNPNYPANNQAFVCGANNSNSCNADGTLKNYASGTSCDSEDVSCGFPYAESGNHDSICGATFNGEVNGISGSWDTASACANSTTLKTYYSGNSCTQINCQYPKPVDCSPYIGTCHGDILGYNGSSCSTSNIVCPSTLSGYTSDTPAQVCGPNNLKACDPDGAPLGMDNSLTPPRRIYNSGTITNTTCDTGTCGYPYSPSGNHDSICGVRSGSNDANGCSSSTPGASNTLNTYYSGNSCTQSSCSPNPVISCAALDQAGCHGSQTGFNGLDCTGTATCSSNAATYANTYSKTNVCGLNNDKACSTSTDPNITLSGGLRQYFTGALTDNTCTKASCGYPYAASTSGSCYTGSPDCPSACKATQDSCYPGNSCIKSGTCPNTLPRASSCPTGGCTTLEGSATGGVAAFKTTGNSCVTGDEACIQTSTQLNKCPNTNGIYTCYSGDTLYYHPDNTCGSVPCPHFYGNGGGSNQATSCSLDGCNGGVNQTYTPANSCTTAACPISSTQNSCTVGTYTSNGVQMPLKGCTLDAGGTKGVQLSYHDSTSCRQLGCAITSNQSSCPSACLLNPPKYHGDNSCTMISCPNNYQNGGLSNQSTQCSADGCTSPAGGTQQTYIPANSCSPTTASCPLTSTSTRCSSGDGYGCSGGSPITYHSASSCTGTSCSISSNQAAVCPSSCYTSSTIYYHPTGSCSSTSPCDHYYAPSTGGTPPTCRTSDFAYSDGSQCGYTIYAKNCNNSCNGNRCLATSRLHSHTYDSGDPYWWWEDYYTDGSVEGAAPDGWIMHYTNNYWRTGRDVYSDWCGEAKMKKSAVDQQANAHRCDFGVCRNSYNGGDDGSYSFCSGWNPDRNYGVYNMCNGCGNDWAR